MLDKILDNYKKSDYDFREYAFPEDPLSDLFEEWVNYYRMKWAIAKTIQPASILEVGVRYGYSSMAFLQACPEAKLTGIDADAPTFGGQPGAVDWAECSLSEKFDVTILRENSQGLTKLPGGIVYDLIHVDGQQDGDGTYHDLDLASKQARYILVDGYQWTRDNYLATNEWLWLNKAIVEVAINIPGYAGELLIRTKVDASLNTTATTSEPLSDAYTSDYYLNDCGGYQQWCRSNGQSADPRLQAVADVAMTVASPTRVVDLGAGRGELTGIFARQGVEVTAIDYSKDSIELIERTLQKNNCTNVEVKCGSVLDSGVYDKSYDLAVASDIVEHLSPAENDALYKLVSQNLKSENGTLVIHTAPNVWRYKYEHPRQQRAAKQAGFWLPRTQRTWYERLMHINEQNPRVLKKQLLQHFPHVFIWFTDDQGMGGSLLRDFKISDFRRAHSIFAIASHKPINTEMLADTFQMLPLSDEYSNILSLDMERPPASVSTNQNFSVSIKLENLTDKTLKSKAPNPLNLSYHWLDSNGNMIEFDGLRTLFDTPLPAYGKADCAVQVRAPSEPGEYTLRIAPVQEMVKWYESSGIDYPIIVNG